MKKIQTEILLVGAELGGIKLQPHLVKTTRLVTVDLVWQGEKLFAGHVTRTWKEVDPVTKKSANLTASGTAEVK